jgi:hypothetical protein
MKNSPRILLFTSLLLFLIAGVVGVAPRADAQNGSVQFVARITPSAGEDEPVRSFPFYLLSKSYEEIKKEAAATAPAPNMDAFIDGLTGSKELKAWMKTNHRVNLSGEDFTKKLKIDDIMDVPEFFTAYVERNSGDQTVDFPRPKYKPEDKVKDPDKYAQKKQQYHDAIRAFFKDNPDSTSGLDIDLEDVNPGKKWDAMMATTRANATRRTSDLARGKYLVARADTDLQGQASIHGVPPGNYWLSSLNIDAAAGDERERWDVLVTVRAGQPSYVTLNNVNAVQSSATPTP